MSKKKEKNNAEQATFHPWSKNKMNVLSDKELGERARESGEKNAEKDFWHSRFKQHTHIYSRYAPVCHFRRRKKTNKPFHDLNLF